MGHHRLDVRTCFLTEMGLWPGVAKAECERQVDAWLADAYARRAAELPAKLSGPSEAIVARQIEDTAGLKHHT